MSGETAADAVLAERISRRIAADGPLSVAAFMALALHDPEHGYYARRLPLGTAGDFTTAPEISQIFGELVGLWCALAWQWMGRPDPVLLAELGPGRGVLMTDLLRAAASVPGFRKALRVHLVETSGLLRDEQHRRLAAARPVWMERADQLPPGPLLLVANEFLDALPIRQFVCTGGGWAERCVAVDAAGELVFVDGPASPAAALLVPPHRRRAAAPGAIIERCPAALALAAFLGRRVADEPGAALLIDYGDVPSRQHSTLQAVARHSPAAVLAQPGSADLSAAVDFVALAEAARAAGAAIHGPVAQGPFLLALGAAARLERLSRQALPAQRQSLEAGLRRLVDPGEMGEAFKVMAVATPGVGRLAGFEGRESGR